MSAEEVMDYVEACLEEAEHRIQQWEVSLVLLDAAPWYDFTGRHALRLDVRAHRAACKTALDEIERLRQAGIYDSA